MLLKSDIMFTHQKSFTINSYIARSFMYDYNRICSKTLENNNYLYYCKCYFKYEKLDFKVM